MEDQKSRELRSILSGVDDILRKRLDEAGIKVDALGPFSVTWP